MARWVQRNGERVLIEGFFKEELHPRGRGGKFISKPGGGHAPFEQTFRSIVNAGPSYLNSIDLDHYGIKSADDPSLPKHVRTAARKRGSTHVATRAGYQLMDATDAQELVHNIDDLEGRSRPVLKDKDGTVHGKSGMAKNFYTMTNVGSARYVLNHHDGVKTHSDGSPFYDMSIFGNKRDLAAKIGKLKADGYKDRSELPA